MKVVVFEACRSPRFLRLPVSTLLSCVFKDPRKGFKLFTKAFRAPRFLKPTEGILLSRFFKKQGIEFELFTNDYSSPKEKRVSIDADLIRHKLAELDVDIAHFAVHGNNERLVLKWDEWDDCAPKPVNILTAEDIRAMTELDGMLVVSGACASAPLAPAFLSAGARNVVAPKKRVRWRELGQFFVRFYEALFCGVELDAALTLAVCEFPEFKSFHLCPSDDPMSDCSYLLPSGSRAFADPADGVSPRMVGRCVNGDSTAI